MIMRRFLALHSLLLVQALLLVPSCGVEGPPQAVGDTNTNWLKRCETDAECDSPFSCLCGSCTIACQQDDDCSDIDTTAVCTQSAPSCPDVIRTCQEAPSDSSSIGPETGGSSTSPGAGSSPAPTSAAPSGSAPSPTAPASSESPAAPSSTQPAPVAAPATPVELEGASGVADWSKQPSAGSGQARGVTVGGNGGVFVVGSTQAEPGAAPDAFAGWYSPSDGTLLWTDSFGTEGADEADDIVLDAEGNIFVVGSTEGALNDTDQNQGNSGDAFLVKYSSMGAQLWTQLVATQDRDYATGVAVDGIGTVFMTGALGSSATALPRAFIASYSTLGEQLWVRELGALDGGTTIAAGLAVNPADGTSSVVGWTQDDLGDGTPEGIDAFAARYSSAGDLLWVRQFGTDQVDEANAVALDAAGNLLIAGRTYGDLDGPRSGETDCFLVKYLSDGQLEWVRTFGGESQDIALGIALDTFGNIFISGATAGALDGNNLGGYDAYVAKFSAAAELSWFQQFGGPGDDYAYGIATDQSGDAFVAGATEDSTSFIERFQ